MLPSSWVQQLTAEMEAEIAERRAERMERGTALTKKLSRIAVERQKLLRAFYGNAIPIELLKSEQDRLTAEERAARQNLDVSETDLGGWEEVLRTAIELAGNCYAAYLKARPSVRRRFNQAVLEAVYAKDRRVARAEFSEVFAPLFSRPSSNKTLQVVATGSNPCLHLEGRVSRIRGCSGSSRLYCRTWSEFTTWSECTTGPKVSHFVLCLPPSVLPNCCHSPRRTLRAVVFGLLAEMERKRTRESASFRRSARYLERDDWHEEPPEPVRDGCTSGPGGSVRASQMV